MKFIYMILDKSLDDDKLKYYLLNYINDIQFIRQSSKKKELYFDFFTFILDDTRCLNLIQNDYNFNNVIGKLINQTLHFYLEDKEYNGIYQKFSKIKIDKDIYENGNQVNEILI